MNIVKRALNVLMAILVSGAASSLIIIASANATTLGPTAQVSFTFDDGLLSSRTLAADALRASGVSATNYIITSCVGKTKSSVPACPANAADYMTWAQITELQNTYGWNIGSHTETHPYLASTDPQDQPQKLTVSQVKNELINSLNTLKSNGYSAADFASPYGDYEPDGHPVLSQIAKSYATHRGFADVGYNTFPYNDYLLLDQQILSTTTVTQVKAMVDTAIANKQWLILTFHEIVASGAQSTNDEYDYNVNDLASIAAYVQSKGIRVVHPKDAIVTSNSNMLANGNFNSAIGTDINDKTIWSTDDPVGITQDTLSNGSYDGTGTGVTNSVRIKASSVKNTHLFSPVTPVEQKPYVVKSFVDIQAISATLGEIGYFIEEYDASGVLLPTLQYKKAWSVFNSPNPLVRMHGFVYTPSATAVSARLQIVIPVNSGVDAYLDNVQMFAQDGSTTSPAKPGDVNGDTLINAVDLSILSTNWNKTGMSPAQGDLNNDGSVNALDLSLIATNWGK